MFQFYAAQCCKVDSLDILGYLLNNIKLIIPCWAVTASAMADLTGNEEVKRMCSERFKTVLLPVQMDTDGSFPQELKRTKPFGYSLFNIDAMCNLAHILSTTEDNLWEFKTNDGNSLRKGMEFIYPYIED